MKPILYSGTETAFERNGFGRIDAISCTVTEELNGAYEMEMEMLLDDPHYGDVQEGRLLAARHDDSDDLQPFEIYQISRPLNGRVTVRAQHISYRTAKMVVMPFTASSAAGAMSAIAQNCVGGTNFTFWTDIVSSEPFAVDRPMTLQEILGGGEGGLLSVYGGEYEWDKSAIKLHASRGTSSSAVLRYGKDITELKKTTDISEMWTGVAPFWQGRDSSDQTVTVTLTEKVVYAAGYNQYDYGMVIPLDMSSEFDDPPTEAALRTAAQAYVAANAVTSIPTSIDVSFIALWQTDEYKDAAALQKLKLGDSLRVVYTRLGVDNQMQIVKTVYNVLMERYNSVSIGTPKQNLASVIRSGGTSPGGGGETPKSGAVALSGLSWMKFDNGRLVNYG